MTRKRRVVLALGLAAAGCGVAAADSPKGTSFGEPLVEERSRVEIQPSAAAFTQVTLDNPLGDIRVEGHDGATILVEAHKHAPDAVTVDRLRVSLVPGADGRVRIATTAVDGREFRPVARSQVRIDLRILAPRNARIEASTAGGRLQIENMDAGGELDSSSGSIAIKNVSGELITHSVSGPTSLTQVFGSVDAATLWSDVDLDSIGGKKLVASATMGKIAGRRVRSQEIELTTTHGAITFEAEVAALSQLVASSLRGNIDVRVRHRGSVMVRARAPKVDLGTGTYANGPPWKPLAPDDADRRSGWSKASIGPIGDPAAMVELQSRFGMVQFAVVE